MTDGIWAKVGTGVPLTPVEKAYAAENRMNAGDRGREAAPDRGHGWCRTTRCWSQELHRLALDNPTGFKQLVMSKYSDQLSPTTRTAFTKMQADVDKPEKQQDWATDAQRISGMLRALGYDKYPTAATVKKSGNKTASAAEAGAAVGAAWRMAKQAYIEKHGTPPVGADADTIAQNIKLQFATDPTQIRGVLAAERYGFNLSRRIQPGLFDQVRAKLRARNNNQEPTQAEVEAAIILLGNASAE